MQVMVNAQPIFDPRVARAWVKSFEVVEEAAPVDAAETPAEETTTEEKPEDTKQKGKKVEKVSTPTSGLLGKMASSGLLIVYPNNKMRFTHSVT